MSEWRAGSTVGRTLYRDGVIVGLVDTKEMAEEICSALCARGHCESLGLTLEDCKVRIAELEEALEASERGYRASELTLKDARKKFETACSEWRIVREKLENTWSRKDAEIDRLRILNTELQAENKALNSIPSDKKLEARITELESEVERLMKAPLSVPNGALRLPPELPQEAVKSEWRAAGMGAPRALYKDNEFVGVMETTALAEEICEALRVEGHYEASQLLLKDARAKPEAARTTVTDCSVDLLKANGRIADLEAELAGDRAKLVDRTSTFDFWREDARKTLKKANEQIADLESEVAHHIRLERGPGDEVFAGQEAKIDELTAALGAYVHKAETRIAEFEEECAAKDERIASLETGLEYANADRRVVELKEEKHEWIVASQKQAIALNDRDIAISTLEKFIDTQRVRIGELEASKRNSDANVRDFQAQLTSNMHPVSRVSNLRSLYDDLVRSSAEQIREGAQTIAKLSGKVDTLTAELKASEGKCEGLSSYHRQAVAAQEAFDIRARDYQTKIGCLESESRELNIRIAVLDSELSATKMTLEGEWSRRTMLETKLRKLSSMGDHRIFVESDCPLSPLCGGPKGHDGKCKVFAVPIDPVTSETKEAVPHCTINSFCELPDGHEEVLCAWGTSEPGDKS